MKGTPAALTMVFVVLAKAVPLTVRLVVTVMVPAVVPVRTVALAPLGYTGVVLPAGMVKLITVPPEANWIIPSATPVAGVTDGANVSETAPVMFRG